MSGPRLPRGLVVVTATVSTWLLVVADVSSSAGPTATRTGAPPGIHTPTRYLAGSSTPMVTAAAPLGAVVPAVSGRAIAADMGLAGTSSGAVLSWTLGSAPSGGFLFGRARPDGGGVAI